MKFRLWAIVACMFWCLSAPAFADPLTDDIAKVQIALENVAGLISPDIDEVRRLFELAIASRDAGQLEQAATYIAQAKAIMSIE